MWRVVGGPGRRRFILAVFAVAVLTLLWAAVRSRTSPTGLAVRVLPAGQEVGTPLYTGIDPLPPGTSVAELELRAGESPAAFRWDGFVNPTARITRFGAVAAGRLRVRIDNQLVIDWPARGVPHDWYEEVDLAPGPHSIIVEYDHASHAPQLELLWDLNSPFKQVRVPSRALSPQAQSSLESTIVEWSPAIVAALGALWAALIVAALWALVRRMFAVPVEAKGPTALVLAGATILFAAGIWWGWPGGFWAPDELDPGAVLYALSQHFANGWFDRYPPLHFYLLSIVYSPFLVFSRLGWLDDGAAWNAMFLAGRGLSVAMAVGMLAVLAGTTSRVFGARLGWRAALLAAVFLPTAFYAKTANLDVPYLFWFVIALACLAEALTNRRSGGVNAGQRRAVIGFAVAGACAIATKDQAYGLFVLPALYLAWSLIRRAGGWRDLGLGAIAGIATLVVAFNLPFNWSGFLAHVDLIVGPASQDYRMFPASAAGQLSLAWATLRELLGAVGVAGVVLCAIGVAVLFVGRNFSSAERNFSSAERNSGFAAPHWWSAEPRTVIMAGALACLSYYLTFLAPIGYVYDRFLLPMMVVAAWPAAIGLDWLAQQRGAPSKTSLARAAGVALIAILAWRAISVDVLLIADSRYRVEAWLREHMTISDTVGTVNQFGYLPRFGEFRHREFLPTREDTLDNRPTFIVVNIEFPQRFESESPLRQWLQWLESAEAPYSEVFRYKRRSWWSALMWQGRFRDTVEDPFSNLDKANPEVVIYKHEGQ